MVMARLWIDLVGNLTKPAPRFLLTSVVCGAPSCNAENKSHDDNDCQRWSNGRHGIPPC